jgi:hypothetical protein
MTPKTTTEPPTRVINDNLIVLVPSPLSVASNDTGGNWIEPQHKHQLGPNVIINNNGDNSAANIFAFGTFANKNSGIVYHKLTRLFPFVLLEGSVCFFVLYHYKSNGIIADPITGLANKTIFEAYKKQFDKLTKQGFHIKLNIMNNQATKYITQFLDKNKCKLQLVEPHNHRINAAERAIQKFKNAFIAALSMTDSNFTLQLWDKLNPPSHEHPQYNEGILHQPGHLCI